MNTVLKTELRLALFAYGVLLFSPLHAADIYRWVDQDGRTHISEVVPEKYRKSATRIDSRQYELTAEQRREAEARVAQEKVRAAEAKQRKARSDAVEAANSASAAAAAGSAPRPATTQGTDCATLRRLYRESQECFAPYRTATGTTKAEAFEKCTPVADPVLKCGPISD